MDSCFGEKSLMCTISFASRQGYLVQQFDAMTVSNECLKSGEIRRLSTMSTVACKSPHNEPYCIEWQWYWKDEFGMWKKYAEKVKSCRKL